MKRFKLKKITIALLSFLLAAGIAVSVLAFSRVYGANRDITSHLTYTYSVKYDQNGSTVSGTDYQFKNGVYTLTIDWFLGKDQPVLDVGDYFLLPFTFAGNVVDIVMSSYSFDFLGTKPVGGSGTAGTAVMSKVDGSTWNLKATFNDFLKNFNNVQGTFTLQFYLRFSDDGNDQEWDINGEPIATGKNPTSEGGGSGTSNAYTVTKLLEKDGRKRNVSGVENVYEWTTMLNGQSMSKADFFDQYKNYKGSGFDGTPQDTIRITDTLGPGQILLPVFSRSYWQASLPYVEVDPAHFRYGGPGDTYAYFIATTVDLREVWAYFADPANTAFINSMQGYEVVNPGNYAIIPGPDYIPPDENQNLGSYAGLKPGGVPMTNAMFTFIRNAMLLYRDASFFGSMQSKIYDFCDRYLWDISPYMSNVQRTASGFSFDLDTDAIDGRYMYFFYYSQLVNPAQLLGNPKEITNAFSIEFGDVEHSDKKVGDEWLSGSGSAVGDKNTLTIFKKSVTGSGDMSGAVFTVERLGSNPITTGGAVDGKITLTTTAASNGLYYVTTGSLGSYNPNEIYKITETTAPVNFIGLQNPIYLKIDPGNDYSVTLCDADGNPLITPPSNYGLCGSEGEIDTQNAVGIYVNNAPNYSGSVVIEGTKDVHIIGGAEAPSEIFEFILTQVDNIAGDPYTGGIPITRSASRIGPGPFAFDEIIGLAPGIYCFKVQEKDGGAANWTYDTLPRIIVATVDENGSVIVNDFAGGAAAESLTFINQYETPSVAFKLCATKNAAGAMMAAEQFRFELYSSNANADEIALLETGTNSESGSTSPVSFSEIIYTTAGERYYLIKEVPYNQDGWTSDQKVYHIKVSVTGTESLLAELEYRVRSSSEDNWGAWAEYNEDDVEFNNVFVPEGGFCFIKTGKDQSGNEIPLAGVEFELYACTQAGHTQPEDHSVLADNSAGCCWDVDNPYKTAVSGSEGLVSFEGLPPGTYLLAETKTNAGYQLPQGQWLIEIGGSGAINITGRGDNRPPAFKEENGEYILPNYPVLILPRTGSITALLSSIAGSLLFCTAMLLWVFFPRRHKCNVLLE